MNLASNSATSGSSDFKFSLTKGYAMSETFKELAAKAANMEKQGELNAAASCWRRAGAYSDQSN